jgi:hypothetical protein
VFWVISVYFNTRNTPPKYGTFLLGHPVYCNGFAQGVHKQHLYKHGDYATVESGAIFMPSRTSPCHASLVTMQCCDKQISAAAKQHATVENAVFFHVSDQEFIGETEVSAQSFLSEFSKLVLREFSVSSQCETATKI